VLCDAISLRLPSLVKTKNYENRVFARAAAAAVWNVLPEKLKQSDSLTISLFT